MQRPLALALALALPLSLAACSGGGGASSDDPGGDAFKAQSAGQHEQAIGHFDAALAAADPGSEEYHDLSVARCESLAWVDPARIQAALAKLQDLTVKDYGRVAKSLLSAKAFDPAAQIMDMGVKAFPDDAKMGELRDQIVAAIQTSGDEAGNEALKGLGYLGGDK